jgi:hypothetical protein
MTELSPAAQAVAKAALYVSSCDPEDYPHQAQEIAAAALRAARYELAPSKTIKDIDYLPQAYVDGYCDALDEILALAIELEAQ